MTLRDEARYSAPEVASRLVRVSPDLMAVWATRTDDGRTLTVEWGDPGPDGFYEPTFRVSGSTEVEREAEAIATAKDQWDLAAIDAEAFTIATERARITREVEAHVGDLYSDLQSEWGLSFAAVLAIVNEPF